jgi:membrane fusion protein (multidrug efflux system)
MDYKMKRLSYSHLFLLISIFIFSALFIGCMGGGGWGGGGWSMPPMPVEVDVVGVTPIEDRFEAVGTIEAADAISVVAEIEGVVKRLPFEEGGTVRRGELIALLDDVQASAENDRAEAVLEQSETTFNRVKAVVDQGAGSPQDLDDASSALKVAQANADFAKARWEKTRITAPFSGVVGARRVSEGAFVRPGDEITTLARFEELRVKFSVPERFIGKLTKGASVAVTTTAYPDEKLTGEIAVVDPILDPMTRTSEVIAVVQNPEGKFKPGMSANISAILSERGDALTVSSEAIFVEGNQAFVYVIQPDSTAMRVPLTLGLRLKDRVEVVSGLTPGTQVVRAGHQKIFPSAKVIPIMSGAAAQMNAGGQTGMTAGSDTTMKDTTVRDTHETQ